MPKVIDLNTVTDLKHREKGALSYTTKYKEGEWPFGWGWGDGYIAVPKGHRMFTADYLSDGIKGITTMFEALIDGAEYTVFGFDTIRHWPEVNEENYKHNYVLGLIESIYQENFKD